MTAFQILFIVIAAMTLGSALMVVTTRHLVHAALWLVLALFGVAAVFVLLNAGFLAVAQVIIYIGAIAILLIFAIMLTRRVAFDTGSQFSANWGWAGGLALVFFLGLLAMLYSWQGINVEAPALAINMDQITQLGEALVSPNAYVIPFEIASVLLLVALIGAIMIAWDKK